ncbi:MAG: histidine phosphotransferase family protein [Rhodobacteraceae bacterium]|nr:histidine phosphotransferase family protein [Paracoccaceae bacterium]
MHHDEASLAALIGSRICHDLISPIGAISNGLELVGMTSATPDGPEMSLIQQSCDHAAARIRFFRIAFGSAADARTIPMAEARRTLADHYAGTRISAEWHIDSDLGRDVTQMAYLAALCLETALPKGGVLDVSFNDQCLTATGHTETVLATLPIWSVLNDAYDTDTPDVGPPHVQFALLARICVDRGIEPQIGTLDGTAQLRLSLPVLQG